LGAAGGSADATPPADEPLVPGAVLDVPPEDALVAAPGAFVWTDVVGVVLHPLNTSRLASTSVEK
jgi:hypothetical protein